jgi:hypothetical protein
MKLLLQQARKARDVAALLLLLTPAPAGAVQRLVLTVSRVSSPLAALRGGEVIIHLDPSRPASLAIRAGTLRVHKPGVPPLRRLTLTCATADLGRPLFACHGGRLTALAGTVALEARLSAGYDPLARTLHVTASRIPLAGGQVQLTGTARPGTWGLTAEAFHLDLAKAMQLVRPWFALAAGDTVGGHLDTRITLTNLPVLTAGLTARATDLGFSNGPGTVVGQQLSASLAGTLQRSGGRLTVGLTVHGVKGQALIGPALLNLTAHPLALTARLTRDGTGPVDVSSLDLAQRGVVDARAQGILALNPHPGIESARVELTRLIFPGAYTSYLQIRLAANAQGTISSSGELSGEAWISRDAITRVDLQVRDFGFEDPVARLFVRHANGEVHWAATAGGSVPRSHLGWSRLGAYGLAGGPARLTFLVWKRNFALLGGTGRLPVLNGAILIHTLVGRNLGLPQATFDFDADLTPISMPRLCRAFGWPIMNGQLSGHIPLVRYRHHELTFDGNLVARVFDGTITGRHIRLQHPLGRWPQLRADVEARGLDLGMVTHTFAFGSMTGRVDADIRGLQLFDWSPVAFDARLYTMPGDRSAHLINQKAITRIAALGGAGGAVTAALESGVLRFFHTFHYRRLAIGCRLRNQVCRMSGVGPAPDGGYYLVQGSWVPQLNIIGNVRRVNWPMLLTEIRQGISARGIKVK